MMNNQSSGGSSGRGAWSGAAGAAAAAAGAAAAGAAVAAAAPAHGVLYTAVLAAFELGAYAACCLGVQLALSHPAFFPVLVQHLSRLVAVAAVSCRALLARFYGHARLALQRSRGHPYHRVPRAEREAERESV